jgi:ankyrin repeat protein
LRTYFLPVKCGPRALERKFDMPVRRLPSKANLEHLRYQAKDLLRGHAARDAAAAQRLREFHPRFEHATDVEVFTAKLRLTDAQLAIAREAGFPSWARLKRHIEKPTLSDQLDLKHHERIEDATFRRAVELLDAGDAAALRSYLKAHPKVGQQRVVFEGGNYFRNPTLLEFVAENPVRHGKMPANIVEVTRVILDAGVEQAALNETLMLVATGSVARECRLQLPMIDLLCDYGADTQSAARAAALLGEHEAARALIGRGARIDLPVAAALGRTEDARRLLPATDGDGQDRQLALSMASDFGHADIVRLLLDAGEDPNRYNPIGGHSHTTPLHQAAGGGHEEVVRLLVERGARLDMKDVLWHGTPADWARHGGKVQIEKYLRGKMGAESRPLVSDKTARARRG